MPLTARERIQKAARLTTSHATEAAIRRYLREQTNDRGLDTDTTDAGIPDIVSSQLRSAFLAACEGELEKLFNGRSDLAETVAQIKRYFTAFEDLNGNGTASLGGFGGETESRRAARGRGAALREGRPLPDTKDRAEIRRWLAE